MQKTRQRKNVCDTKHWLFLRPFLSLYYHTFPPPSYFHSFTLTAWYTPDTIPSVATAAGTTFCVLIARGSVPPTTRPEAASASAWPLKSSPCWMITPDRSMSAPRPTPAKRLGLDWACKGRVGGSRLDQIGMETCYTSVDLICFRMARLTLR